MAANASATTSNASSSSSSPIESGGRKRKTLPQVPQVRTTTPLRWQYAATAAVRAGSGVVVPGTGISLHNRGAAFVAAPDHPNRVGPRKRPYHTIIPGFVSKDGAPVMTMGVMGGPMQPQGQVQVMVRIADYLQNPQAACDGPRFRWISRLQVSLEDGFPSATVEGLRRRGHDLAAVDDYNAFGACQAIWRMEDGYLGVSDPRRDGQAAAF